MKASTVRIATTILFVLGIASIAHAQNRERFGISAKAGAVNAVSGHVTVTRAGQAPQLMTNRDDLASGDIVRSANNGQAEILLNPGTYLRLAENSEFVLVDNSLENLLVRLNSGSAIIEATGPDNIEQHIPIITEQKKMTILRSGIYRVNVAPGVTELFIRQGRAALGGMPTIVVKSGKKVTIRNSTAVTAKLNKSDADDFDSWSKERGKTLARANQRLSARALNGLLASDSNFFDARFGRWGLWAWSPFGSCYTFLPFFYGWGSPYGAYYGLYAGFGGFYPDGRCCRTHVYNQPVIVSNPTYTSGPNGSSNGGIPGSSGSPVSTSPAIPRAPMSSVPSQTGRVGDSGSSRPIYRGKDPN